MSKLDFELEKAYKNSDNPVIVIGGDFNGRVRNGGGIEEHELPYSAVFSKSRRNVDGEENERGLALLDFNEKKLSGHGK